MTYTEWLEKQLIDCEPIETICEEIMYHTDWCEKHCDFNCPQAICLQKAYRQVIGEEE